MPHYPPRVPEVPGATARDYARALVRYVVEHAANPDPRRRLDERLAFLEQKPTRWLRALFPHMLRRPDGKDAQFAMRHYELWRWFRDLKPGERSHPEIAIWPRGGGKSTSIECGVAFAGATGRRRYALYVCRTQRQANDHVGRNIAGLLQSARFADAYPDMGAVTVSNLNRDNRGAWSQSRLFCANGFKVDAIGLNAAARGVKIDADRPDLIILDDIDEALDSPGIVQKMVSTISKAILPAGANHASVVGAQNLIHPGGIFAQLARRETDFLVDAHISGPHKAIEHLEIGYRPEPSLDNRLIPYVRSGTPTWNGQDIEACNAMLLQMGESSFLAEAQQEVDDVKGSMFEGIDLGAITVSDDEMPEPVRTVVWCDPAVTNKDRSDANGICAASLCTDGRMYVRRTFERRGSPLETLRRAIMWGIELQADKVGVETDQGGDTWEVVYQQALESLIRDGLVDETTAVPFYDEVKAGAGYGPKVQRGQQLHSGYEHDLVRHLEGNHALGLALKRFPLRKPFDLVDAEFWVYNDLLLVGSAGLGIIAGGGVRSRMR